MEAEGYVPDRDIIIALTSDEKSGPFNGAGWLTQEHRALVDAKKITTNYTLKAANRGGHSSVPRKDNAITALADALAKVGRYRFPVTETAEAVRKVLERVIADTTVQVIIKTQRPSSPPAAVSAEIMNAVTQATRDVFGDIPVIPSMLAGATDSRFLRTPGIPAYGVAGLFMDPTTDARTHGRDERMRMQSYFEGQEFLYRLTKLSASPVHPVTP